MNDAWLDWLGLDRLLMDKEIVFFGASEVAEKTLKRIKKRPMLFIDNSQSKEDTFFHGIRTVKPSFLKEVNQSFIILICILAEHEILIKQLTDMGYKQGIDFFFSPILRNQKIDTDIKSNNQKVLFTSAVTPNKNNGGGIYSFSFDTKEVLKLHDGRFCQMTSQGDYIYAVEHFEGVKVFNKELQLVRTFEILPWSTPHGISINEDEGKLYVANTGLDSISVLDIDTGEHLDEIFISQNLKDVEKDRHHINDLLYHEGYLYVSMFSFSGLWKNACYDGGVAQIDLKTKKIVSYPIQNMWMPHSISIINGEIVFIDSMRGDVYKTNNRKLVNVNGFARGIAHDGRYYYIGQSEHRYFDRLKDVSSNIHLNCGIHVFDEETKVSRFYSIDNTTNIHTIMVKDF